MVAGADEVGEGENLCRVAGGDGDPDPGPDLRAYDVALMGREAV